MAAPDVITGITEEPLDVAGVISAVSDPSSGGIGVFIGTVREQAAVAGNEVKAVLRLEYEAYAPLADQRLREIAEEAGRRWALEKVVALHRTGTCELGEPTVVVASSAAHRAEALEACRWVIDELKATVPIWKKEIYADGSAWVGSGP